LQGSGKIAARLSSRLCADLPCYLADNAEQNRVNIYVTHANNWRIFGT
jgi:hypothetical protein